MKLICELNSPCPSQKTSDGNDICLKEEGECEFQRLEDADDIENFVINHKDGTSKVVNKGFFCEMKPNGDSYEMKFDMVDVSGHDLEAIVFGCIQLGERLGMFDIIRKNSCHDKECSYHEEDADCPAKEGCAGYEGADTI